MFLPSIIVIFVVCSKFVLQDGLQFTSIGSTLGFVLLKGRKKQRPFTKLLHTCCDFVWFALSSRATNRHSFSGAHPRGIIQGFSSGLLHNQQALSQIFVNCFIEYCREHFPNGSHYSPITIFNTYSHTILVSHIHDDKYLSTTSAHTNATPLPITLTTDIVHFHIHLYTASILYYN